MSYQLYLDVRGSAHNVSWILLSWAIVSLLAACGGAQPPNESPLDDAPLNKAPAFTSDINFFVPEQTIAVGFLSADDVEGDVISYSIKGGVDAGQFFIDSHTGELRFKQVPDFEVPADSNANNTYMVVVAASNAAGATLQTFSVSVTDEGLSVDVPAGHIKTLRFSWPAIVGATHYKLYVNPDGVSDYTQVGENVTTTQSEVTLPVHLTDWVNSLYMLEGYRGDELLYRSDPEAIIALMHDSIGYIKASNAERWDLFGISVALSADGNTLAVGAHREESAATGIDGDQDNNWADDSGAVYVFSRVGGAWAQEAYVKASNTDAGDEFGNSVALSADGNTLAVGAWHEDSAATGIDGGQDNNWADDESGAVYVFSRVGGVWTQQAYVKASNAGTGDRFGERVALSTDGNTLAVGAWHEDSGATGIDGGQDSNWADDSGAVYVFSRVGGVWTQQAYVKASNAETGDGFGESVALSADGNTLVVGASRESSAATGIDGDHDDNWASAAGAVYVFSRVGGAWTQQAYVKASNAEAFDWFGESVALSADGNTIAVGTWREDSAATGIDGGQSENSANHSGAVYVFSRVGGIWTQQAYVKASNTEVIDWFGKSVALNADGNTLAVGASGERSAARGVDGDQDENFITKAGAVYVFRRVGGIWTQQAYVKSPNTEAEDVFGESVALSADGNTLAVGALLEDSAARGVDGDQADNSAKGAGAVYLY